MSKLDVSSEAKLPTKYGEFLSRVFCQEGQECMLLYTPDIDSIQAPLLRIHSECLTGDALGSLKCDCGEQLQQSLALIAKEGGVLVYHRQEGRNIGLFNKIEAYALQDEGLDTVEANIRLGFRADERTYDLAIAALEWMGLKRFRLLSNNPKKVKVLEGFELLERIALFVEPNSHNRAYLETKKNKMGHLFE